MGHTVEEQRSACSLTEKDIENIVSRTVQQTLISLGVDASNPIEVQRDFQTLRDWRKSSEAIRSRGMMTIIGIVVAGALGALWVGLQHVISGR